MEDNFQLKTFFNETQYFFADESGRKTTLDRKKTLIKDNLPFQDDL